jgi:hypothetical protein
MADLSLPPGSSSEVEVLFDKLHESDFDPFVVYFRPVTTNVNLSVSVAVSGSSRATLFLAPDSDAVDAATPPHVVTRVVPFMTSRIHPGLSVLVS